ncbi:hypothetical protein [Bergeyella zoohelcum]|uniref:Uncharacterized protein n=1 Tax=Bergeyella zoohelcum ATCC 43767 TaxID=883096 RepID=K1LWX2_9FLAO|nr:hypothetical protein [Bergeyella zoohelcum]EKB56612.1 hypothetical protein HMPREF9699_01341 [Bergeyella zoohelcum ATCC 43767]SUV48480.1 Uncharacterised protein [Bergeyella zoohelcum]
MKKYLVSNSIPERMHFIKKVKPFGKRFAVYNKIPLRGLESYFDKFIKLDELYDDQTFLKLLGQVDSKTTLFLIDLGLDYCSFQANYIKPYTKLHPLSQQAKETFIIDGFAFYNTEKAIYRPFLYIDPNIIGSSVQEFYNTGAYKDFDGNQVENYYKKIAPYMQISTQPLELEVVKYSPTKKEKAEYEKLKKQIIMVDKFSKPKVIRMLIDYIENTESKKKAIKKEIDADAIQIIRNDANGRKNLYKEILLKNPKKVIFYSSEYYGADEIELSLTFGALERHNKLIALLNG